LLKYQDNMKSTLKHFKNYFSGNILTKAISFLFIPIFTRLLPVEDYGILNIFNSYTILFTVIMTLNTYSGLSRYAYEEKDDFEQFYFTNILITLFIFLFTSVLFLIFQDELATAIGIKKSVVILYLPIILFNVFNSFFNQIFQPKEQSKLIVSVNIIYAIGSFALKIGALFLFEKNYINIIISTVVIDVVFIVYFIIKTWRYIGIKFRKKYLTYILIYCIPLMPYTISDILLSFFDRIIIGQALGNADAGLYSLSYNIGILFSVFYRSLMITAWMPKYFEYMNTGNYEQHDLDIVNMLRIVSVFGLLMILFSEDIGRIIIGTQYLDALSIIPLVVLGYFFECIHYIFLKNAAYAKKTLFSTVVLFSSAILNIFLNLYFVPRYGYKVAALTTVVSYFFMAVLAWVINKYILRMHSIKIKKIFNEIIIVVLSVFLYYILKETVNEILFFFIKCLLILMVSIFFFKDKILTILYRN